MTIDRVEEIKEANDFKQVENALAYFKILSINGSIVKFATKEVYRQGKHLNIKTIIEASKNFLEGRSYEKIGVKYGITKRVAWGWINLGLPQLYKFYKDNQEVRQIVLSLGINSGQELIDMYTQIRLISEERRPKMPLILNPIDSSTISEISDKILDSNSTCRAAQELKISPFTLRERFEKYMPKSDKRYKLVKEKMFKNRTGDISKVIDACRYFIEGYNYKEISILIKGDRTSVKIDVERRITELYKIYNQDIDIRESLIGCQILSFEQLEALYCEVRKVYNVWKGTEAKGAKQRDKRNVLVIEMADFIIDEYNNSGKILNIITITKLFNDMGKNNNNGGRKIKEETVSHYLKGVLPFINEEKYNLVISIWSKDSKLAQRINSYNKW